MAGGGSRSTVRGMRRLVAAGIVVGAMLGFGCATPSAARPSAHDASTVQYELKVITTGAGTGLVSVTSQPPHVCSSASPCAFFYDAGTTVDMRAQFAPSSHFASWGGDCTGDTTVTNDPYNSYDPYNGWGRCRVTMDADRNVTADFEPGAPTLLVPPPFVPFPPSPPAPALPPPPPAADLFVEIAPSVPDTPPVGGSLDYAVTVSEKNVGASSDVRVVVSLPVGYTATSAYADRGSGCTVAAQTVVCDIGGISTLTPTAQVIISGLVDEPGDKNATVTATSVVEQEPDATLGDNTAIARVTQGPPPKQWTLADVGSSVRLAARTRTSHCRSGTLPDRRCSPGAYYQRVTDDVSCSVGFDPARIRHVTAAVKRAVDRGYRIGHRRTGPIGYVVPLELGGSNDIANLYAMSSGAPAKTKLVHELHAMVCIGETDLQIARQQIASNWQTLYKTVFGTVPQA